MRDHRIDVLRSFGLCLIILAHCSPPGVLFQVRNFDVPLMVLISGIAFSLSFNPNRTSYLRYVKDRLKRLILPVWCFLTIFFISCMLFEFPSALPHIDKIIDSYLLHEGIGYVWIIRVFFMVALIAPLIFHLHRRIKSNIFFLSLIMAVFVFNEVVNFLLKDSFAYGGLPELVEKTLLYALPYGAVFALGLRFLFLTRRQLIAITGVMGLVFITIGAGLLLTHGKFVPTQAYKYPPQIYYFSYAIFMSLLLWMLMDYIMRIIYFLKIDDILMFMGRNSIWIYLWHIAILSIIDMPYYVEFPAVLFVSVMITFFQFILINKFLLSRITNPTLGKNVRVIFTG